MEFDPGQRAGAGSRYSVCNRGSGRGDCDDDGEVDEMSERAMVECDTWGQREQILVDNNFIYDSERDEWRNSTSVGVVNELMHLSNDSFLYFVYGGKNKQDTINHPAYYTDGKIEVSDFIADKNLNFFRGNVVKYVARAGKKDPAREVEDLQKARWYIDREIERLGGK